MSDLGQVVQKLTETNQRLAKLEEQNKESGTAASIIAASLPEVLSDRRVAKKREDFDRSEGITTTDDDVRDNTKKLSEKLDKTNVNTGELAEKIDKTNELMTLYSANSADDAAYAAKTNSDLVVKLTDDAISGNQDAIAELIDLQKNEGLVTEQLTQDKIVELTGVLEKANNKENINERNKNLGETIGNALDKKGFSKFFKSIGGYFTGLAKSAGKGALNILKTLGLAAGLGLLIAVLESDMLKKFLSVENIERFRQGLIRFIDGFKRVANAFISGGFIKGIRVLAEELGLIEKETDEENTKLINQMKNKGIAASIIAIGGSFLLLKKAFTSLRNMVTGQTTKTLNKAGVNTTKGGGVTTTKGRLKPGSVNAKGFLIDNAGKATTTRKGDADFKKNQNQIRKSASKLKGGKSKLFQKVAKKIPLLGVFFSIEDILGVLDNPDSTTQEKTAGIAQILLQLGGSTIGSLVGGVVGGAVGGPFGAFIGSVTGGISGYFASEDYANAAAQFLLGEPITAFDHLKEDFKNRRKDVRKMDTGKNLTVDKKTTIPGFTNVNGVLVKNKPKNFPIPRSRPKDLNFRVGDDAAASGERMIGGNPFLAAKMGGNSPVINNFNTITKGGDTTSEVKNISNKLVTPSLNQLFIYST